MKWIGRFIGFCWRFFWRLVWLTVGLVACLFLLLWIVQKEAAPQLLSTVFHQAEQLVRGEQDLESLDWAEGWETLENLATDTVNTQSRGRWETNTATVYIETQDSTFRQAYEEAIANWNATGAFHFVMVEAAEQADIIATEMNDGSTQAAGEAVSSTNSLTNYFISVTVKLNRYYLLHPTYGYDRERIVYTAEHELGHAIGLPHDDSQTSVMESSGSYSGIQPVDVAAVVALYGETP